jgi:hypothetical protein
MDAKITIGIDDYNGLRSKIEALSLELGQTKVSLDQARLGDGAADARRLAEALGHALKVIQFAIANLHPLTVRGWPYEDLRALGNLAPDLPGVDESFRQVAKTDWGLLTKEMEKWERARAEGREQELLAEENASRAPGADHPMWGVPAGD